MPEAIARELTFGQAVREALAEEMRRDSRVCIFGEDVAVDVLVDQIRRFGVDVLPELRRTSPRPILGL